MLIAYELVLTDVNEQESLLELLLLGRGGGFVSSHCDGHSLQSGGLRLLNLRE